MKTVIKAFYARKFNIRPPHTPYAAVFIILRAEFYGERLEKSKKICYYGINLGIAEGSQMQNKRIENIFLYGSLSREEYARILPLIWQRNKRILKVTSALAALMGMIFLFYALISGASTSFPYLILMLGSIVVYVLSGFAGKTENRLFGMILCYAQMLLVCVYAGILSTQPSNYEVPATSIVVFIALLPLSIDDRLIRMFGFMIGESAAYLAVSRFFKSPSAFSLDMMNVLTFLVVGMVLYGVICTRNVREIYQGVRIESIQKNIISSMATVVEERDESTGGHIARTGEYVRALTEKMKNHEKFSRLSDEYFANILLAAPMHDIGKIRIPDAILNKPGKLTAEEYDMMKRHSGYGAETITKTMKDIEEDDYFEIACNIAKYHHERYDGKGYPDGLAGEDIPLEARIMALADVYDALVSERVYKKALPVEEAVRIIEAGAGTQFDPVLAPLFLECVKENAFKT